MSPALATYAPPQRRLLPTVALALVSCLTDGKDLSVSYSSNPICRQYNCINPIFPGVNDLSLLEATTYQCQPLKEAKSFMQFCGSSVLYDVAVPSPNASSAKKGKKGKSTSLPTLQQVVAEQDNAAATMYFYHLSGMQVEPWQHKKADTPCTKAIKKMVCNTYFPRAEAGCKKGQATKYLRPCKNVCGSYIQACNVQCCDESVRCVSEDQVSLIDGSKANMTRYSAELGPSAKCTGGEFVQAESGARRFSHPAGGLFAVLGALAVLVNCNSRYAALLIILSLAMCLQGCYLGEALSHPSPRWMEKENYITNYQYVPQGKTVSEAILNSCNIPDIPVEKQCSGHGVCDTWRSDLYQLSVDTGESALPAKYCKCYRDWADPECRTKRKSQSIAYVLSLFGGYLGLDHFYLAQYYTACLKLACLGGLGTWWLIDIVRIGCAPMYVGSHDWRLAYDLPHWVFVMSSVFFFIFLGWFVFGVALQAYRREKAVSKMLMQAEDEFHKTRAATVPIPPMDTVGWPTYQSYGVPFQNYGTVPPIVEKMGVENMYSPYAIWQNAKSAFQPDNKAHEYLSRTNAYTQAQSQSGWAL